MTGHDEHEKNNSKYLDNNDDLLCPVTYCAPVSPTSCAMLIWLRNENSKTRISPCNFATLRF